MRFLSVPSSRYRGSTWYTFDMACKCGCGIETDIATKNNTSRGWVKGEPKPFIHGHNRRIRLPPKPCACGCGQLTTSKGGYVGSFVLGHNLLRHGTFTNGDAFTTLVAPRLVARGNCLEYTGYTNTNGYGMTRIGGRNGRGVLCHRVVYEALIGPIPKGHVIMHTCDNPKCCRIEHLVCGTQSENMKDMWRKGRGKHRFMRSSFSAAK